MRNDNDLLRIVDAHLARRTSVGQIIAGGLLIWALLVIFGIPL